MAESRHTLCGLVFSGVAAFDLHLKSTDVHPFVACRDPRRVLDRDGHPKLIPLIRERDGRKRTVWGLAPRGAPPWADQDTTGDTGELSDLQEAMA